MDDLNNLRKPDEQPEGRNGDVIPDDDKKKKLDALIEKFNRDNPAKNPKRTFRGVY